MLNETSEYPWCNNTIKLKRTKNSYPKVFWEADLVDDLRKYDVYIRIIGQLKYPLINLSFLASQLEFRMSYSSTGNDLYHVLPYRLYRQPICDALNTVYRHSLMEDAKLYSNAPYSKDRKVNLCDLMPKVIAPIVT